MENRKFIQEVLNDVKNRLDQLKELVEKTSDQELEDILHNYFAILGGNIGWNFDFMEMILTRKDPNSDTDSSGKATMSNEELDKYFEENWHFLIFR